MAAYFRDFKPSPTLFLSLSPQRLEENLGQTLHSCTMQTENGSGHLKKTGKGKKYTETHHQYFMVECRNACKQTCQIIQYSWSLVIGSSILVSMGPPSQWPARRPSNLPTLEEIWKKTQEVFGTWPCLWQSKVAEAFLCREQDIVCIAGTGKGKTLTFWMPLLFDKNSIQIVVTPLNLLSEQNVVSLMKAGIPAISIRAETATPQNFQVRRASLYCADGSHMCSSGH